MMMKRDKTQPQMLKTLRIKFILLNMLLAVLVLGCAFSFVVYFDYSTRLQYVYSELDTVLTNLTTSRIPQIASIQQLTRSNNSAILPKAPDEGLYASNEGQADGDVDDGFADANSGTGSSSESSSSHGELAAPTIGSTGEGGDTVVLVAVYEVTPNGVYTVVIDYTTANIPASVILRANDMVLESDDYRGYLPEFDLYFESTPSTENPENLLVAYADGSSVGAWRSLAWMLVLVGVAALFVLFLLNIFFSRWALRPVQHSMKQQQQFTADASHELKTPLTVILANMAILRSQPEVTVGEQMQWVDSTHTEAERMQLLVNDMLALSKAESRPDEIAHVEVDLTDLVEGEVLQFESVAFELGVTLDDRIEGNLVVMGDHDRLARMVATLIDNACKYASGVDGARVEVVLAHGSSSGMRHPEAVLSVHNNGPEIPEEDLPHIFDRFYRADKARTSSKGGYGLGLAIGQEIAQEHSGIITVESSPGHGATFTVTLPLAD